MVRRGDDPLYQLSLDVRGTAFDVLPETDYLIVAGRNALTVVTVGVSAPSSTSSWVQLRHNRNLVRLLKFNPLGTGCFASVSGSYIDIYTLGQGSSVQRLASLQAQSRKVCDFCWCPFDDQLIMSCAEGDSVSFWDLRTDLSRPCAQLGLLFGAGQAKFAPHLNNLVLSANGSDLRLWDLRHTSQPIVQFTGHQSRILCLDWHPHHQEPYSFFTSAYDGALKLWSLGEQKSTPAVLNVAPVSAWRLVFSQEGQEMAALSLSPPHTVTLFSNYGLENARQLKSIERGDTLMDAAWHKSTSALKSTTKYLYTLSQKRRLCRHAIAYELSNEIRDEMATPITQSAVDEERDRLVAAAAGIELATELQQRDSKNDVLVGATTTTGEASGSIDDEATILVNSRTTITDRKEGEAPPLLIDPLLRQSIGSGRSSGTAAHGSGMSLGTVTLKSLIGSLKAESGAGRKSECGLNTPQSPIFSDWHRWIRAPNLVGGDLLMELEALRKHTTEGLYTTEINFQRAAIGFSYMHQNRFRKICWEMRFHREFIENGLVFVEVIQKESPLSADKASLFLTMLQQECDEQVRVPSQQTVLCRVFHQLPRIIDAMQVLTVAAAIDVPTDVSLSKASSQSGSANEDPSTLTQHLSAGDYGTHSMKPSVATYSGAVLFPVTYTPSPYDLRVPAPRNCGARFNKSGYLVTFGRATAAVAKVFHHHRYSYGNNNNNTKLSTSDQQKQHQQRHDGVAAESVPRVVPSTSALSNKFVRKTTTSAKLSGGSASRGGARTEDRSAKKAPHPRSLAEYCVLVNPQFGPASTASSLLRQSSAIATSNTTITTAAPFQSSQPMRCASPAASRPTSPWARAIGGDPPSSSAEVVEGVIGSSSVTGGRGPNSLSPPSLLKQQQQQNAITGIGRLLGSSPNSATGSRSFSVQQQQQNQQPMPALQAVIRQRVATMGAVAEGSTALTTSILPAPPIQHQLSAMAELGTGGTSSGSLLGVIPSAVMPEQTFTSTVCVYDAMTLLPISQALARTYKLLGASPLAICRHNREQVARKDRPDLLAVWRLLEQCVTTTIFEQTINSSISGANCQKKASMDTFARVFQVRSADIPRVLATSERLDASWSIHPFGRELINRILEHYVARHDMQTAAVITCILNGVHANGRRSVFGTTAKKRVSDTAFDCQQQQQLERPRIVEQRRRMDTIYRPIVDAPLEQTNSSGLLMFTMDQTDSASSGGKVPPAPPVPPLLPSQQITSSATPSRKTSAIATALPTLTTAASSSAWSRQSSDSNAATITAHYANRTMSDAFQSSSAADRLSPAPDFLTAYQRSTTMEVPNTGNADLAASSSMVDQQIPVQSCAEDSELLLDPALSSRFEELRHCYADILYRWRMYRKCAEVLKHCAPGEGDEATIGTILAICWCSHCGQQQSAGPKCSKCHRTPIYCAICEQPCRGVVATCTACGHGGHFAHLAAWFNTQSQCPMGCGCECKF